MPRLSLILIAAIAVLAIASLHLGIRFTPPFEVWRALTVGGEDQAALIVSGLRVPRMLIAITIGGALGLSGLLFQTSTRNALAEPGLLGINAGAGFAVVLLVTLTGTQSLTVISLSACIGALACAALVFGLALSAGGMSSPSHLLLAGVTIAALLTSAMQILIIADERTMEELLFWLAGGFADRDLSLLAFAAPAILLMTLIAWRLSPMLDALLTDDATAQSLGVPVLRMRFAVLVLAALLAGISVAVAGPIAFLGLAAPHLVRLGGRKSHAQLVPLSFLMGSALALLADIMARFVIYPSEAPVGVLLAMVGVPILIWLLQHNRLRVSA